MKPLKMLGLAALAALGEVEAGEAGRVVIEGNFTYSGCTVTEQSAFSTIELEKEGHEHGNVVGEGEVHVNCVGINSSTGKLDITTTPLSAAYITG